MEDILWPFKTTHSNQKTSLPASDNCGLLTVGRCRSVRRIRTVLCTGSFAVTTTVISNSLPVILRTTSLSPQAEA